ncbi:MAG: hypothetical protein BWZ10_02634 [candidate division BRC1 bacterium ADurb.BinA364]|nr:MAG: hypothetical protein BWZ10_02634 [candidate division BRC1 bacterium ADurb.BinA364]
MRPTCVSPGKYTLISGNIGCNPAAAGSIAEYSGMIKRTSWPRALSAGGKAPATSANPPVLAYGATSDAI